MVERYDVIFDGRLIGKAYVSPDLKRPGFKNVSVMPVDRSGNFSDSTLELHFPELVTAGYPSATPTTHAINELLSLAKIEPHKVAVLQITSPPGAV